METSEEIMEMILHEFRRLALIKCQLRESPHSSVQDADRESQDEKESLDPEVQRSRRRIRSLVLEWGRRKNVRETMVIPLAWVQTKEEEENDSEMEERRRGKIPLPWVWTYEEREIQERTRHETEQGEKQSETKKEKKERVRQERDQRKREKKEVKEKLKKLKDERKRQKKAEKETRKMEMKGVKEEDKKVESQEMEGQKEEETQRRAPTGGLLSRLETWLNNYWRKNVTRAINRTYERQWLIHLNISGDTVQQVELNTKREMHRRCQLLRLLRTLEYERVMAEERQRLKREKKEKSKNGRPEEIVSNSKVSRTPKKSAWTRVKNVFRSHNRIHTDVGKYEIQKMI